MDKKDVVLIDLERLAALMAAELPNLDCPECCGPVYQFIEVGARVHQEEWEWALVARALLSAHLQRKSSR